MKKFLCKLFVGASLLLLCVGVAGAWSLEEAAKPYKGTEVSVSFLDRPGYRAIEKMLPDFELDVSNTSRKVSPVFSGG